MAQQVITSLIDDLDGSEAQETVAFAFDGATYEIDLSAANAAQLREAFGPFAAAARKVAATRKSPGRPGRDRAKNDAVRTWARIMGMKINDRGRIPEEIFNKWVAAGSPTAPSSPAIPVPDAADRAVRSREAPAAPAPPARGSRSRRAANVTVPLDTV